MELYIHIPFCARKCEYCSFVSYPAGNEQMEEYIDALLREADIRKNEFDAPVTTVFIGGGTPSLLSSRMLTRLVRGLEKSISLQNCREFTVEANPGTLTESFLKAASCIGVNRLSMGMQAAQNDLLKKLGRIHTFREVRQSVEMARKYKFRNLNLDIIFGIPGQTMEDWEETLDEALSLDPEHISAYGLIPEEGTPLYRRLLNHELELPDQDDERDMYDTAIERLKRNGLMQYEISNFAKDGYECIHNIGYWTQVPYVGLGLSAASMRITSQKTEGMSCVRRLNPCNPEVYARMIRENKEKLAETETIQPPEARFETMMLALRMNRGISEERFQQLHGVTIASCYGDELVRLQNQGLMQKLNGNWTLTRRGMDLQNAVLIEFMKDSC